MEVPFSELNNMRPSKNQDFYKISFDHNSNYEKVKYLLSRTHVRWCANDFTKTLYFCGKKLDF